MSAQPSLQAAKQCHFLIVGAGAYENRREVHLEYIQSAQAIFNSVCKCNGYKEFLVYHMADSAIIDIYFDEIVKNSHTVFIYFSGFNGEGKVRLFNRNDYYSIERLFDKINNILENTINVVLFMDIAEFDHQQIYRFLGYDNFGFISRIGELNDRPKEFYVNLRKFIEGSKSIKVDAFFDFFQDIGSVYFYVKPPKYNFILFSKN